MAMLDGPERDSVGVCGFYTALRHRLNRFTIVGLVVSMVILILFAVSLLSVHNSLPALHSHLTGDSTALDQVSNATLDVS
jgi:hypothetical protein